MSFLNSVLNTIGTRNPQSPSVPPPATKVQPSSTTPKFSNAQDTKTTTQSHIWSNNKRKAAEALEGPREKAAKTYHNAKTGDRSSATVSAKTLTARTEPAETLNSRLSAVYSGTSKPAVAPKPSAGATPVQRQPKTDREAPHHKEPKKGSYAEIMARAKANQNKPQAVGTINHKPKEKGALTFKKEMKLQKQVQRDKKLGIAKDKDGSNPNSTNENLKLGHARQKGAKSERELPAKKPKPQPVYKGTMNPASVTAKAKEKAAAQMTRRNNEYAGTDEELDEEDELEDDDDDGYGYDEEESDDMEAGFSDVEQEETAAGRAAKKEDEEEARLEARRKKDKEERRRRVEELAKRAKPQRY